MAPPRKHDTDVILDAARALALEHGPRAVTVAAIAQASGAPQGTLYHRFGARDAILATAWLRALRRFRTRALAALPPALRDDDAETPASPNDDTGAEPAARRDVGSSEGRDVDTAPEPALAKHGPTEPTEPTEDRGAAIEAAVALAVAIVAFTRAHADDARLLLVLRRDDLLDNPPTAGFTAELDAANAPLLRALRRITIAVQGDATARSLDRVTRAVVDVPHAAIRRHPERLPRWLEDDVADAARRLLA